MTERGMEREQRDAIRGQLVAEARKAGRRPGDITADIDAGIVAWRKTRAEGEAAALAERAAELVEKARKASEALATSFDELAEKLKEEV